MWPFGYSQSVAKITKRFHDMVTELEQHIGVSREKLNFHMTQASLHEAEADAADHVRAKLREIVVK